MTLRYWTFLAHVDDDAGNCVHLDANGDAVSESEAKEAVFTGGLAEAVNESHRRADLYEIKTGRTVLKNECESRGKVKDDKHDEESGGDLD